MKKILVSTSIITAMAVALLGTTYAVFSDTESIDGNTLSAATVDIDLRALDSGTIEKPLDLDNMLPGEWSEWARAEVYNTTPSTNVRVYMYADNLTGAACDMVNLDVRTGHASGDETAFTVYNGKLTDLQGSANRAEITGYIFTDPEYLPSNTTAVVQQRAELDSSADNSYQGTSCTWDEVFVAEGV